MTALSEIISGLRNFRSSLLTGTLIGATIYVAFYKQLELSINPSPAIINLYSFQSWMPLAMTALCAFLVGSLYVTALEGAVDWVHRRRLGKNCRKKKFPLNRICLTISPISQASLERLQIESKRYYRELTIPSNAPFCLRDEDSFLYKNQADILWMEGKLTGLPLKTEYRQYRAEGEWQLAVAILLPFTSVAMLSGFGISRIQIAIACIVIVSLSIKLAGYGLYYYRRANSLIAHHIADGSLMTPAMETASRICSSQDVSNKV